MHRYFVFSCYPIGEYINYLQYVFFGNYKTEILTIENNKKRVEEDRRLYEFIGIPYNHLGLEFDDQSFYGYHKDILI